MKKLSTALLTLTTVILLSTAAAPSVKADPLYFSNVVAQQNGGSNLVDLFANPGTTLFGSQLTFFVNISGTLPPGGSDTLLITYTEAGSAPVVQSFQIPLFNSISPPFTLLVTITSPGANYQGVAATLTIDLLNSSPDFLIPLGADAGHAVNAYTYSFIVAEPVPEPMTLILLGSGLTVLAARLRRREGL